ncbi:glycosyltransferase [Nakamurella sp. YIM 132087]|uniref:Glycosyltransferase n=1 Tax=Nakamurella alba TaxID=2665158 RepID=A0A7K1FI22_9ACTN|nr:glycosyltransferase [Nakamurella alba]
MVICAYTDERWDDLRASVESAVAQTVPALEVLVVIDHNDELLDRARRHFFGTSPVRVLASVDRKGLSGARNSGVRAARGGVVAFLDDDATAADDWIETLRAPYVDPTVAGVGGHATPVWPAARPGWLPTEFDWVVGCSYTGQPETTAEVRNFIGCNMSIRRSYFDAVGGFSHAIGRVGKIPLGCEETELCIRIRQHDPQARMVYEPDMRVRHRVSADRVRPKYFFRRCYAEGLSKAVVAELVGAQDGLGSERSYVGKVLPAAVIRGVRQGFSLHSSAVQRKDGRRRAGAVVSGLAATTVGYAYARLRILTGVQPKPGPAPSIDELPGSPMGALHSAV